MRCNNCGAEHTRKRFCSNKCKDAFHNRNNPRGFIALSEAPEPMTDDGRRQEEEDQAMEDATQGWDEGGWLSDDSGT